MQSPEWKFAPYLVATNCERLQINYEQALQFAEHHNTYLYRWSVHLRKWRNRPTFTYQQKEGSQHPIFWQYFVPGADAYLSHNNNTSLGLANGTQIKLHSLSFSSQIAEAIVKQKQELSPPGSIITLSDDLIPSSVNFTLDVESQPSDHKIECCNLIFYCS